MSLRNIAFVCGLFALTGCATVQRPGNANPVADWELTENVEPAPVNPVELKPPAVASNTPPALPSPAPASRFPETWVSLIRWSQSNGFGGLQRISPATVPTYALTTSNGVLVIRTDNLSASWNGLELRLGFAPQLIDNRPFVHTLDLQKNILPLVRDPTEFAATNRIIVIDPGHGGEDAGAKSVLSGQHEKEFTLDWARRLEPLLITNGWKVFLTRTNDRGASLADRVALADRQNAGIFVSLHFNSPGDGGREQAGLETYCLTPVGMRSSLTRGYSDDSSQAFPNNAFDEQNVQLAARLHRALLAVNGAADRGVRRARFLGVLRGQRRPAVLIEGGYLSNPKEARCIADPVYRQKLAEAVAKALTWETETKAQTSERKNPATNLPSAPPDLPPSETRDEQ